MKRFALAAAALAVVPAFASDPPGFVFTANLTGWEEVPSVATTARGTFIARLAGDYQSIDYELSLSGLQAPITQAHIHFAGPYVAGPIVIWLCGTTALPGPAGTPACVQSGTVRGTITAGSVLASPATQQLAAGDLQKMITAMRSGAAYANVHTAVSPGGEMRGQIQ
jgi:CHRD domain-containing protein